MDNIATFVYNLFFYFYNQSLMKNLGRMISRWGRVTEDLFHRVTAGCALLMLTVAAGCNEYDDAELRGSVDDLNNRLTKLEAQVTKLNSDYATLSGLVTTLQQKLHLESVTPDGKGGYLLAFSDGTTASVAGSESVASIPVLGIATAEDGLYYWTKTVDGKADWLLDTEGNKLPVSGVTPLLGVDADGYWTISYDGGKSVQQLLDAEGKPIVAQGDSAFIKEVTADAECLYVTLNDGKDTRLEIPLGNGFSLTIAGAGEPVKFTFGETKEFAVERVGVMKTVISKPDEWKVTYADNLLTVTAPTSEHASCADLSGEVALIYFNAKGLSKVASMEVSVAAVPTVAVTVPTDFSGGYVQRAVYGGVKVAEICREYVLTGDVDRQMTVVYPVVDGKADLTRGLEVETGGSLVWNTSANTCTYTAGTASAPITKLYVSTEGELVLDAEGYIEEATVEPDLLRDVRGTSIEEYRIVKIGAQYWMAESLRAENFADGTPIPTDWGNAAGSYIYLNESAADWKSVYGTMYSGKAVTNAAGLAPAGWDVPTADDVALLRDYIGSLPGLKLRSTSGWSKYPGTNITGFNALPGQYYTPISSGEQFGSATADVLFWTSTVAKDFLGEGLIYYRFYDGNNRLMFDPDVASFAVTLHSYDFGHYVRCVRR